MLRKMHSPMSNEKAFTLIEVIVCLVLIGIMAAVVGMGFMRIAEGYIFAKQNAETAQKAQIAIARIVKELSAAVKDPLISDATPITGANLNSVTYTRYEGTVVVTNTIAFSSPNITVQVGSSGTATTLINNVETFDLEYCDGTRVTVDPEECNSPTTASPLRRIKITLGVSGQTFNSNVYIQEF